MMAYKGPMWVPHGLKFLYGTHMGPIWASCPDSAHMGPICPCMLGNSHYCLIKDLNRFLSRSKKDRSKRYFCCFCLHAFTKETLQQEHTKYCSRHEAQRIELPIQGRNDILQFKEFEKTLKVPFVIYADFETNVTKLHTCQPNPKSSASIPLTKLEVCGFAYKIVCKDSQYTKPSVIYRGEDAGRKLIECLLREEEEIQGILSNIQPMNITEEHQGLIENAVECCLCKVCLTAEDKKYNRAVRHHNHLTGEIIGAACKACNLRF